MNRHDSALVILQVDQPAALDLQSHVHSAGSEVNVAPIQAQNLARAQASEGANRECNAYRLWKSSEDLLNLVERF